MDRVKAPPRSRPVRVARRVLLAAPAAVTKLREHAPQGPIGFVLLVGFSLGDTIAGATVSSSVFPPSALAIALLLGGLILSGARLRRLVLVVLACLVYDIVDMGVDSVRIGAVVVVVVTGLVAQEFARSREETGLGGLTGDVVLVELQSRLEAQGQLPSLPAPWRAERVVKAAGGAPFSGDFVVSALVDEGVFEVALVDVSGKGVDAGTRSLLLSGALGGLLGAKAPEDFLTGANTYLVRQEWDEGFATAVHLVLDLHAGSFAIGSAGHPPVAHFDAGSGRWGLVEVNGPALGLIRDASFPTATGQLRPGDALLLYTDGLIEVPGRDLEMGIDKLLGAAEGLVTRGFEGGGQLLIDAVSERSVDDRGLVLLWRSH